MNKNKIGHLFNTGFTHQKQTKLVDEYIASVELIVNRGKVGRSTHQNQWRFPLSKRKDGVSTDFSLKGSAGQNILLKSDNIIDVALQFYSKEDRREWRTVLIKYHKVLAFLNQCFEFTEAGVMEFRELCGEYAGMWVSLTN